MKFKNEKSSVVKKTVNIRKSILPYLLKEAQLRFDGNVSLLINYIFKEHYGLLDKELIVADLKSLDHT